MQKSSSDDNSMQCIGFLWADHEEQQYLHKLHFIHGPPQPEPSMIQRGYEHATRRRDLREAVIWECYKNYFYKEVVILKKVEK